MGGSRTSVFRDVSLSWDLYGRLFTSLSKFTYFLR